MSNLVAFCENPRCGAVFSTANIIGGPGSARISFTNTRVGPCPACGGFGVIPDGVYQYSNNAIRLLAGPKLSVERLRAVEEILRRARQQNLNKTQVIDEIKRASPDAAAALQTVPDQNNWLQWLAIVIALVSLVIQIHSTYFKEDDKALEKKFMEHLLKESEQTPSVKKQPTIRNPKVGRNDSCPCGSGKKYKKCCLLQPI